MIKSNSKTWGTWAIRKVRNGRVKFHGRWFYIANENVDKRDKEYRGELDEIWFVFHSYDNHFGTEEEKFLPYLCIWGSLEYYNAPYESEERSQLFRDDPKWGWSNWYPDADTAREMISRMTNLSACRHFESTLMHVLYPELSIDDAWDCIDWKYREVFPDYHSVNTHPEKYARWQVVCDKQAE